MNEARERLDTRTTTDRLQVALHNQRYEFVLQNLRPLDCVLEIGTGTGNLSVLLADRCRRFVGLEFNADSCRVASERLGGKRPVVQGDARRLPFGPGIFTGIVCLEVLEHLGDFHAGLRDIHRCLRKDGMAIISVPYRRIGGPSATNVYHLYEPGERELVSSLQRYFANVQVQYQFFQETPIMRMARGLHLRRPLGLQPIYGALSVGQPQALARLKLGAKPHGMKMHLAIVAQDPRATP
jgi:ubiquinone/menaquinone biosynthesis C-methylase UbiE